MNGVSLNMDMDRQHQSRLPFGVQWGPEYKLFCLLSISWSKWQLYLSHSNLVRESELAHHQIPDWNEYQR